MKATVLAALAALAVLGGTTNPAKGDHDEQKRAGGPRQETRGQKQTVKQDRNEEEGDGEEQGGEEKQSGEGLQNEGGGQKGEGRCEYKKVVTYRTVIGYEVRSEKYVKCVTLYDECDKPYKVNKVFHREVKVPVKKVVAVVKWVKVCDRCDDDEVPPVPRR
jgi:hypothetical protein